MDELVSRQAAIDALKRKKDKNAKGDMAGFYNTIIQNDIDALMQLPSKQAKPTFEQIKEYCERRCLTIITNDFYHDLITTYSAQPELKKGRWIRITQGATPEKYMCPFCHRTVEHEGLEYFVPIMYPFCHCGADLRGGEGAVN